VCEVYKPVYLSPVECRVKLVNADRRAMVTIASSQPPTQGVLLEKNRQRYANTVHMREDWNGILYSADDRQM
jgi:hypothetical protein